MKRGAWLAVAGTALAVVLAPLAARGPAASAAGTVPAHSAAARPQARHVVIAGVSGLTWSMVSKDGTPALWRLAAGGSVGSMVDYAQQPLACPADGWLTLNSAARAQGPRPCSALPAVVPDGAAAAGRAGRAARIPAMPQIIAANRQFHEAPDWGLLGSLASCATAVGPGAALALASAAGTVASYLASPADLSRRVLARCPLTVVDLTSSPERVAASSTDRQLARLAAELPPGTLLLVAAPGAAVAPGPAGGYPAGPPHLMATVVSGPGYASGLLGSRSARRPGIVVLTDLTPTVAAWLGHPVPAGTVGARITRAPRGSLAATVAGLRARDTAEQVWIATHGWFYAGYALADALAFGIPVLLARGSSQERRARRARCWRTAGIAAATVPLASYLANLAPWWTWAHPAWCLYGLTAGWAAVATAAALAGPWRRSALGPFGVVCGATLLLLAADVMSGSRLQLDAPFGLSLLVSGRYYGIGNEALGIYCVSALVAAACAADVAGRLAGPPGRFPGTWRRGLAAAAVGAVAVIASGWPGFGAKVGGTIALVPCLVLLTGWLAGARPGRRWAVPVAASGLVVFLAFAVTSYFLPAAGVSDMGAFAGALLHGRGGNLLQRKVSANVGSLTLNFLGWLVPVAALATGIALWRPAALRLRTLTAAFTALPLLRVLTWLAWLVLVIGWLADDSGVIVPAAALPFVAPVTIAMAASVSTAPGGARYFGNRLRRVVRRGQAPEVEDARVQYQLSRVVIGPVLHLLGRPAVTGLEYVPASGPAILASNHLSFIDSMYLPLVISRPVVFPAKAEYFSAKGPLGRIWAAYLRSTNQLEMDRSDANSAQATLEAAAGILRRGDLFGFYPEGTRSPDGRLYRGRAGLGWLALNTGAPVIPVAMLGTRKMLPPGAPLPRPAKIRIKIGKPLEFSHLAGDPPGKARRIIADEVMRAIADLSGQEYVHEYASDVKARLAGEA